MPAVRVMRVAVNRAVKVFMGVSVFLCVAYGGHYSDINLTETELPSLTL
jgi:hypothetical protein